MSLLRTPPSGLTDISQILDFAQGNYEALKNYSKEELLQKYSSDEFFIIINYLVFFRDMKHVAEVVGEGNNVCAEYYLWNFKDKFFAIIKEADSIRGKIVNEDILCLCDYFIDHCNCLEGMVLFMADKIPKNRFETGGMAIRQCRHCHMLEWQFVNVVIVKEIAQEPSNSQMEASNTRNSGYGAVLNEQRKRKNGGNGKEEGWTQTLPATPIQPSPDNRTNNPAIHPAQQPSENQKLNFAGGVTPDEDPRKSPETSQAREVVVKTLEKIKCLHQNSNENKIMLETLNSIKKESNSSEAHFGDGDAKTAGTRGNNPGTSRPSDFQRSKGGANLTEGLTMAAGYSNDELSEFNYSITLLGKQKWTDDEIEEVMDMGWFRRFLDTKVPNDDRWLFHWFSLKVSELNKFKNLFEDIEKKLAQLKDDKGDADKILSELYRKLLEYHMYAESAIDKDNSKICKYHKEFIGKADMLENIVRRVEGAQNRQEIRGLQDQLSATSKQVTELTAKLDAAMEKIADLSNKLTEAAERKEEMMEKEKELKKEEEKKQLIKEQKTDHEKYYRSLEEKFERILTVNEQLLEENRELKIQLVKMHTLVENY